MAAFLVQYGRSAFVGWFTSEEPLERGTLVIIDSPRGRELGTIMGPQSPTHATIDGAVLRPANPQDQSEFVNAERQARAILQSVHDAITAQEEPVLVLDCEVLHFASEAILHVVSWGAADLTNRIRDWSDRFGIPIRLYDLAQTPKETVQGCGTSDCGSGNCSSCSSGSGCATGCGKSVARSADEVAELLREVDAVAGRRELL